MGAKIANIAVLIVIGTIIADLIANPKGTKTIVDGTTSLWSTSLSSVRGTTGG